MWHSSKWQRTGVDWDMKTNINLKLSSSHSLNIWCISPAPIYPCHTLFISCIIRNKVDIWGSSRGAVIKKIREVPRNVWIASFLQPIRQQLLLLPDYWDTVPSVECCVAKYLETSMILVNIHTRINKHFFYRGKLASFNDFNLISNQI